MKKIMFALAASTLACLAVGGCVTKSNPARTEVSTPMGKAVYHCPPGHRKKGECL